MVYNLKIKEVGNEFFQILLEDESGMEVNILDVGYGISQVLPIITQIIFGIQNSANSERRRKSRNDNLLLIEQPELHLHPAAQAELANLFVQYATANPLVSNKLLIETHSEHIIRKIQALIAKNEISSTLLKIYYVDKNTKGEATITDMELLPDGRFKNKWPSGFFDKAQELSMELLMAASKSRS